MRTERQASDYGLNGLPTTFILDGQGKITEVLRGPQTTESCSAPCTWELRGPTLRQLVTGFLMVSQLRCARCQNRGTGKKVSRRTDTNRKEATKVSIATAVILNVVAVVGLLALLAATMRLPYHLPTSPRSAADERRGRAAVERPHRKLAHSSRAWSARARLLPVGPAAIRRRHRQSTTTVSTAIAENRIAR